MLIGSPLQTDHAMVLFENHLRQPVALPLVQQPMQHDNAIVSSEIKDNFK